MGGAQISTFVDPTGWAPMARRQRIEPTPALRAFVAEKRRLHASWGAIGRMLGCSEVHAREAFGAECLQATPEQPTAPAAPPTGGTKTGRGAFRELGAGIAGAEMETLGVLSRRARLPHDLADIHGLARRTVTERLKRLREAGLVMRKANGTWTATPAGRDAVAEFDRG